MFEKEAEEYAKDSFRTFVKGIREIAKIAFQKGAEFGYNKALEEATHNYNAIIADYDKRIEKLKQDLDVAIENANRQEQWEIYSTLNDIYNNNF